MKEIRKNHNHSIITAGIVFLASLLGFGIESLLMVSCFWFGREHSQAEYRFMKMQGINRSDLGFLQGFNPIAWNKDSLIIDLLLPIFIGLNLFLIFNIFSLKGI